MTSGTILRSLITGFHSPLSIWLLDNGITTGCPSARTCASIIIQCIPIITLLCSFHSTIAATRGCGSGAGIVASIGLSVLCTIVTGLRDTKTVRGLTNTIAAARALAGAGAGIGATLITIIALLPLLHESVSTRCRSCSRARCIATVRAPILTSIITDFRYPKTIRSLSNSITTGGALTENRARIAATLITIITLLRRFED